MNEMIIIEVGSTNTKSYFYDGVVNEIGLTTIEFKNNYKANGKLLESDIDSLTDYVNELKSYNADIHVYGTSIFRDLSDEEFLSFVKLFNSKTNVNFNVVTADMENEFTVYGVIGDNDYEGRLAVMIGGGGSTELSIVENKRIIEKHNLPFGAMDIMDRFPDINNDIASTIFPAMVNDTVNRCAKPENKAATLVLAGGDYLRFYLTLDYPLEKNQLYEDSNQPYMMDVKTMEENDIDFFYNRSLTEIQNKDPDYKAWWSGGTRGMRICVHAVANILEAEYIIPSKISMVYGIIEKLKSKY